MSASLWNLPADKRRKIVPFPFAAPTRAQELTDAIAQAEADLEELRIERSVLQDRMWAVEDEIVAKQDRIRLMKSELSDLEAA